MNLEYIYISWLSTILNIKTNQDAVFLDLGSNLGVYSLLVAELRQSAGDHRWEGRMLFQMMVHDKHAWEFQVWSCCCCGCCRGQPCIHQVSVTTWFMIHMTYDLDHIVRTICCVLLFLGDWQFSRNVLNFSHSVANNNISREMITLVHNAVRYIYTNLVHRYSCWGPIFITLMVQSSPNIRRHLWHRVIIIL